MREQYFERFDIYLKQIIDNGGFKYPVPLGIALKEQFFAFPFYDQLKFF